MRRRGLDEKKKGRQVSGGGGHAYFGSFAIFFAKKIETQRDTLFSEGDKFYTKIYPRCLKYVMLENIDMGESCEK